MIEIPETSSYYLIINKLENCAGSDETFCDSFLHTVFKHIFPGFEIDSNQIVQ